ncbi:hypothetical protein ACFX1S_032016 [Malus domestica]
MGEEGVECHGEEGRGRVGVGIEEWVQNGYGCEGKRDGRDRGDGVGRGNSTNQGLLSMGVNISNEHDWDMKSQSQTPQTISRSLLPAYGELPPPDPESKKTLHEPQDKHGVCRNSTHG